MDQLRVAHPLAPRRGIYPHDPQPAEIPLASAAIPVGVAAGAHHLLVGQPVAGVLASPVALRLGEDLLAPPAPGDGVRGPAHLSPFPPAGSGPACGPAAPRRLAAASAACASAISSRAYGSNWPAARAACRWPSCGTVSWCRNGSSSSASDGY